MGYFTVTPEGFDAALRQLDAVREYRVRIDPAGTPVDVTSRLDNNAVSIRHQEGSGAQADIILRNADGFCSEGAYAKVAIGIDARVDESSWIAVFYGWIDDKGAKLEIGVGKSARARLQAVSLEKRYGTRQKAPSSVLSGWTICDPDNTGSSIVHHLAGLMGLTAGDLDVGTIDYVRDWVELGKRSPWQELRDLAELYRATLYTTAAGKLRLRSPLFEDDPPSLSAEWEFANDDEDFPPNLRDMRNAIQGEYVPVSCNRGTCEFDEYEALSSGGVVWQSVEGYDTITRRISIAIEPGDYWPVAGTATAVAQLQYKDPVTGQEIPYATDVITPTIGAPGSGADIESNGGIPTIISFNGSTGATQASASHSEIILRNNTAGTIVLYKFQLRGDGYRVRAGHTVRYQDAAISDEEDFVDGTLPGTYAAGESQVYDALQELVHRGKGGRRRWSFATHWLPQVQLDARVSVRMPGEEYTTCRVVGYSHQAPNGPMAKAETRLEVEELAAFSPSGNAVPQITYPGSPSPGPAYAEFDAAVAGAETNAKEDLAEKLGYADYDAMVAAATAGETIIDGGYINADLIEAGAITASMMAADNFFFSKAVGSVNRATPSVGDIRAYLGKDPAGDQSDDDPVRFLMQQYLLGGWSEVNKIVIGLMAGAVLQSIIGCRGIVHPDMDLPDEVAPTTGMRLLDFESAGYVDQSGNAPEVILGTPARSSGWSKVGTYSLASTTYTAALLFYGSVSLDTNFAYSAHVKVADVEGSVWLAFFEYIVDDDNKITGSLRYSPGDERWEFNFTEVVDGVVENDETATVSMTVANAETDDHFVAIVVNHDVSQIALKVDGSSNSQTFSGITLSGTPRYNYMRVVAQNDPDAVSMQDEVLFGSHDDFDLAFFNTYYTAGSPWEWDVDPVAQLSDVFMVPKTGGRIQGGLPDGTIAPMLGWIEEQGSDDYSYYVRYSSGEQEIWYEDVVNLACTTASTYGGFIGAVPQITFVKAFKTGTSPNVVPWVVQGVSATVSNTLPTATTVDLIIRTITSDAARDRRFGFHARGFWK